MKAKLKLQKSKNLYPGNIQLIDIVMLNESTKTSNSPYPYCDSLINSKGTQKGLIFPHECSNMNCYFEILDSGPKLKKKKS